MFVRTLCCGVILAALSVIPALAQTENDETRPALPTTVGDTGLWFVPTAEVLPGGRWSGSLFLANFDRRQGLTDVTQIGLTGARGFGDHVELFASWRLVRLSRNTQPFFVPGVEAFGGVQQDYPYLRSSWSQTLGGPLTIGGKWGIISQGRGDAMSFATRATIGLPTGSRVASTNSLTGRLDIIASREFAESFELTGTAGGMLRRNTDEFRLPHSLTWGLGAAFPTRSRVRALVEWEGEFLGRDTVEARVPFIAEDGSIAPTLSRTFDQSTFRVGAVVQGRRGAFLHAGASYSAGASTRTIGGFRVESNAWGFDVRVGWHPGARRYVPPPPPEPEVREVVREVPTPAPPANRPPQVSGIQCDPCVVRPGETSRLTVQATDPDGDPLRYRWTAPQGTFSPTDAAQTTWTAPNQPGTVVVTAAVEDGRGGQTTGSLTLQVVAREPIVFEDVHFDFDRFNLRPEAVKILDQAVATLQKNPDIRVTIEGHTDSIGTNEYNLGLGERRANAVREYLVGRGISADRIQIVSYGEERPIADNQTVTGRALNRRATTIVRME